MTSRAVRRSARVNYDAIAHLYDTQPYRAKSVDPELTTYMNQRLAADTPSILDVGCGTGNQLVANRTIAPHARLVGLDRSLGMLRRAQPKAPDVAWVQADGAALPFRAQSFDFVSCQFALHHISDQLGLLEAVFRVLRAGGRLVLRNLWPQECADWLYYEYFPEAYLIDLKDFWPPEAVVAAMQATGFEMVAIEPQHLRYKQDLQVMLETVRRRDTCSQLLTIGDAAFGAGIDRLEQELAGKSAPLIRADHICFVTIRGEKLQTKGE